MRTRALRWTVGLEQLRALPLAPPSTNDINPILLACLYALFMRFPQLFSLPYFGLLLVYPGVKTYHLFNFFMLFRE